jgi:DNA-nicking Smr family endonuclease
MKNNDLKKLKKQLKTAQEEEKRAEQELVQQELNNSRDQDVFREAMSGVVPLSDNNAHHEEKTSMPTRINRINTFEEELIIHDPLSDELDVEEVDSAELLSFRETGIQNSVFRKLRSGNYRISDELDLHGLTIKEAKHILVYYLQEAVQFEGCCVRIIHGKGNRSGSKKPVLKTHVNHWLIEHDRVLAFHSSKPKDGGAGAVYV